MAYSKQAKKRIRQNLTHRLRNRRRKEAVKDTLRAFDAAVVAGQADQAATQLRQAYRRLDRIAAQGTIHKNAAARKKARLARRLNKMQTQAPAAPGAPAR